MMNGVPLETCSAFKKLSNNKFYYKAASCWYFYSEIISWRLAVLNYSFICEESPSSRDFELTASDPRVKGDGIPG
jgi:hypothetical protein